MNTRGYWMYSYERTRNGIKANEVYYSGTLLAQFKFKAHARMFMMACAEADGATSEREESESDRTESV